MQAAFLQMTGNTLTQTALEKLGRAFEAARKLPDEAQAAIAEELELMISDFAQGHMNEMQRAEVKRRLAAPRQHVPDGAVRAVLRRYNPAL